MKFGKSSIVKAIAVVLTIIMSTSLFAGCQKTANDKDEQGRTILKVGLWPSSEGSSLDNIEARKVTFEEENPDVVVERDYWSFDRKTFFSKAAAGTLPNYFRAQFTEVKEMGETGYAADLTDALEKYGIIENMNEAVLNCVTVNDKVYAVPSAAAVLGLSYNVDLFEKAGLMEADGTPKQPQTLDEVVEFAVKIKEATGKPGLILPTADRSGGWIFTSIAWAFGVNFMEQDEDGKWQATFNTPECVEALQWYKDLKWKYNVIPSNTLVNGEEWYKTFGTEGAGMSIMAGDYPNRVAKYGMKPESIGIMAMPAGPKKHVTLLTGEIHGVSATSTDDQIDAAVRWIMSDTSYKATDSFKENTEKKIRQRIDEGKHVGIKVFSIWNNEAEAVKYEHDLIDKYSNANMNHVRLYNEFVADCPCEIRAEEPIQAQNLYAILDDCIQQVLTDENADCAAIIAKAAADFQRDELDSIDY